MNGSSWTNLAERDFTALAPWFPGSDRRALRGAQEGRSIAVGQTVVASDLTIKLPA
jgi:hypothetical protein